MTLQIVGGRWKGVVIWNLSNGKKRFSELKIILVTINDKMLSQVLRELEEQKIASRSVHEIVPPRVNYELTKAGNKILPIMQAMSEYGEKYSVK